MDVSVNELDVRILLPREKHPTIHARLSALRIGDSLLIINDHDPRPLRFEIEADHPGMYTWTYLAEGPETWRVQIGKIA